MNDECQNVHEEIAALSQLQMKIQRTTPRNGKPETAARKKKHPVPKGKFSTLQERDFFGVC